MNETPYLNASAVKKFTLAYAKKHRAKSFTRVGNSFLARINSQIPKLLAEELSNDETTSYINSAAIKKLGERLREESKMGSKVDGVVLHSINEKLKEIIRSEVHRHPSVGKTLQ